MHHLDWHPDAIEVRVAAGASLAVTFLVVGPLLVKALFRLLRQLRLANDSPGWSVRRAPAPSEVLKLFLSQRALALLPLLSRGRVGTKH